MEKQTKNNVVNKTARNIPMIRKDEHFVSYLMRILHDNSLQNGINPLIMQSFGLGNKNSKIIRPEKLNVPINDFLERVGIQESPLTFLLKHTEIGVVNLSRHRKIIDRFWYMYYKPETKVQSIYKNDSVFYMCEDCMKKEIEELGMPIIHVSHQLPFVKVCYKHKKPLKAYTCDISQSFYPNFKDAEEKPLTIKPYDISYAKFMYKLHKSCMDINSADLYSGIDRKMLQYPSTHFLDNEDCVELKCLYDQYIAAGKGFKNSYSNPEDFYKLLFYIHKRPFELTRYENLVPEIDTNKFERIGRTKHTLIELRCKECGKTFITTPRLIKYGHTCPYCTEIKEQYYTKIVKNVLKEKVNSSFSLKSIDFENNVVIVNDKELNKQRKFNLRNVLTNSINFKYNPSFKMNEYKWDKYSSKGTYGDYYKGRYLIEHTSKEYFISTMYSLVGDEYELVGEYSNLFKPVKIKHNPCGAILYIIPHEFINGKRCDSCRIPVKPERVVDIINSSIVNAHIEMYYDDKLNKPIYRLYEYDYLYNIAYVINIYQFTEEILLQELLRHNPSKCFERFIIFDVAQLRKHFYKTPNNATQEETDEKVSNREL